MSNQTNLITQELTIQQIKTIQELLLNKFNLKSEFETHEVSTDMVGFVFRLPNEREIHGHIAKHTQEDNIDQIQTEKYTMFVMGADDFGQDLILEIAKYFGGYYTNHDYDWGYYQGERTQSKTTFFNFTF